MAGHNKWSQIKHKKAKEDSKRGKAFTKLIKEITVAARDGGGDPAGNPRLRSLLEKAKEINMPIENAQRAIKKGTGELEGAQYEEYVYEGYGPHGIAVIIDSLSDNKNRTVADLRHLFSKHGASLAESGAVSWMFAKQGVIRATGSLSEDELLEQLIDFDVQDIKREDDLITIIADMKSLEEIKALMKNNAMHIESAEPEWVAQNTIDLQEKEIDDAIKFLEILEDHDDVKSVYTNLT